MTFFYCDSGLASNLGHHANSARVIVGELRRRGIETRVLAHQHVHPDLVDELGAEPWFRVNTYAVLDDDPIAGWLHSYDAAVRTTVEDMYNVRASMEKDLIYFNSAQVVQLTSVAPFARRGTTRFKPVIEFGVDPGVEVKAFNDDGPTELGIPDPRQDARATLYRYAALTLGKHGLGYVSLNTFELWSSKAYAAILGTEVGVLPVPRQKCNPARCRADANPITIGIIGHQRGEKGWHLVPEIVKQVLASTPNVRFLLHDGDPRNDNEAAIHLTRTLARVDFDSTLADDVYWAGLLDRCDLIVCPYMPQRFVTSYSAIVAEAIANGIPLVVPANTALSRCCKEYADCETFVEWEPISIASAIARAVNRFENLAVDAHCGADQWAKHNGAVACVDAILAAAGVKEGQAVEVGG